VVQPLQDTIQELDETIIVRLRQDFPGYTVGPRAARL